MTTDKGSISPITEQQIHRIDDDSFTTETVCLVTGAGSGIGRATALAAAQNGLSVAATDVDDAGLSGTVVRSEELETPGSIEPIAGDLTVDDDIERIVERAADLGNLTYLANVAGTQHIDSIEDVPMATDDRMHRIMLRAPLYLAKLCIPHFRTNDGAAASSGTWRRFTATT